MKRIFWIFKSGELRRDENTLFFEGNGEKKHIPIEAIDEIYIFGEISLNTKLLNFLSQKHITLHVFNYYGYYSGSYYPREFLSSGEMIIRQVGAYIDTSKRLTLAKAIEKGASSNMMAVLNYYRLRGKDVGKQLDLIEELSQNFTHQESISSLMGLEGKIRDIYYSAFDSITTNEDFQFEERTRRPPLNRMNSLISFANSLMYTICLSEIYKTHLDPRVGFLHESNFRRFSLNLDVAEIFKPIIIDRLIFSSINEKIVKSNDFSDSEGLIIMNEKCKKEIVMGLDKKLATTIKLKNLSHEVSYRRLIRMECYKIEKHLLGEEDYAPFQSGW